jgi:hypothetical protein
MALDSMDKRTGLSHIAPLLALVLRRYGIDAAPAEPPAATHSRPIEQRTLPFLAETDGHGRCGAQSR